MKLQWGTFALALVAGLGTGMSANAQDVNPYGYDPFWGHPYAYRGFGYETNFSRYEPRVAPARAQTYESGYDGTRSSAAVPASQPTQDAGPYGGWDPFWGHPYTYRGFGYETRFSQLERPAPAVRPQTYESGYDGARSQSSAVPATQQAATPYGYDPYWGHPYNYRGFGYETKFSQYEQALSSSVGRPQTSYQSSYYGPDSTARIDMTVPAGAEVWFSGDKTASTGIERSFVTPSLAKGGAFAYELRVRWMKNGQAVERSQRITVHAGDRVSLQFN